jgi:hypothetical protein
MSATSDGVLDRVRVREVTGIFRSAKALDAAVEALLLAGFDRWDIDLMTSVNTVKEKLGATYVAVEEVPDIPGVPRQAYKAREDVVIPTAAAAGLLVYLGATAAALGVVASGGSVALAIAAAVAGGATSGGIGALIAKRLGLEPARELDKQLAGGGMVLWVRVRSPDAEDKAQRELTEHGAEAVRVHEIELEKRLEDVPLASLLAEPPPPQQVTPR